MRNQEVVNAGIDGVKPKKASFVSNSRTLNAGFFVYQRYASSSDNGSRGIKDGAGNRSAAGLGVCRSGKYQKGGGERPFHVCPPKQGGTQALVLRAILDSTYSTQLGIGVELTSLNEWDLPVSLAPPG